MSRSHDLTVPDPVGRSTGRLARAYGGALRYLVCAASVALSFAAVGVSAAQANIATTPLSLVNGWTDAPYGTQHAGVQELFSGTVVTFTGAIANGTSPVAFTLPASLRPATNVYIPVDMCNATNGRLEIQPTGVVSVRAEGSFGNASCFTSLDGASYVLPSAGTPLTLQNGWTGGPFGTAQPAVQLLSSSYYGYQQHSVRLIGAMATGGTNPVAFTVPAAYRPVSTVYVAVDLCNGTKGRLTIQPNGVVSVTAEGSFANAACFTSLDGASYVLPQSSSITPLALQNGWTQYAGTATPGIDALPDGMVQLSGAIRTQGTNATAFTVPAAFAPATNVYVPVDLCNGTNGRLDIQPSGVVTVQAETSFANAQCFTSLDGVSYTPWQWNLQ